MTSGTPLLIGALLVVPVADAAADAEFVGQIDGVFEFTKVSAQAWTEGQKVYFDAAEDEFTTDGTKGLLVGAAAAVAANPSATGLVRLNGSVPAASEGPQPTIADISFDAAAAGGCAGGAEPSAAQVDTAIATAVAPLDANFTALETKFNILLAQLEAAGINASA